MTAPQLLGLLLLAAEGPGVAENELERFARRVMAILPVPGIVGDAHFTGRKLAGLDRPLEAQAAGFWCWFWTNDRQTVMLVDMRPLFTE